MAADVDILEGVLMSAGESAALLAQVGPVITAKWPGKCRACGGRVEAGSPLARCARYGWCHETCLREAQEAAARRD